MPEPVDLTNCDREPVHVPGSVQAHGVLLAYDQADAPPVLWSANRQLLGDAATRPLTSLLDPSEAAAHAAIATTDELQFLSPVRLCGIASPGYGVLHRSGALTVLEIEPDLDTPDARVSQGLVQRAITRLRHARTLEHLWQQTVDTVRELTGYDRVMVYRFDQDQHGEVVAEARSGRVPDSLLGLHYPRTDIPAPARRLYRINPLRIIVDVDSTVSPLEPGHDPVSGGAFDMTHSVLRSVSPIHIEYLKNMGVHGSFSLSLLVNDELWGLVACHHYEGPRFVPYTVRTSCEMLTQAVSWQIATLEREELAGRRAHVEASVARLLQKTGGDEQIEAALTDDPALLLEAVGATGAAVAIDGSIRTVGAVPDPTELRELAMWWAALPAVEAEPGLGSRMLVTDRLAQHLPAASSYAAIGAGVLGVGFPVERGSFVLWFRPAVERTVRWAGDPNKPVEWGPNGPRLSPRGSFDEWCEMVRDQAIPWSPEQVRAAEHLRDELGGQLYQRALQADDIRNKFLAIVGHDLRNPLGALLTGAEVLKRAPSADHAQVIGERIRASGDRMHRMIEQLLDMTRIRAAGPSGMPVHPRPVALQEPRPPDRRRDRASPGRAARSRSIRPSRWRSRAIPTG
ncbi:MAG: GAF domain-containing protein [Myxococcota bacterium]